MSEKNISINEQEKRIEMHNSSLNNSNLFNVPKSKEDALKQTENKAITDVENIKHLFDTYLRDQTKITIVDKEGYKYYDNVINNSKENEILISNPFITYANKLFPNAVKCFYEEEGVEYSFVLAKLTKNDNASFVSCALPDKIHVMKRRVNTRYSPKTQVAVSLFLPEKNIEIIGSMIDLSKIGVGISFEENILNSEILSHLTEDSEKFFPLIIDNENEYLSILVKIKHTFQSRKDKKINIGAEFYLEDSVEIEFNNFFEKIKKEHNEMKILDKTNHLILSSKMGILF